MRKLGVVTSFLLAAFIAQAELYDDFQMYEAGPVDTVTTVWKGTANSNIVVDPADSGNKALSLNQAGQQSGVYGILTPETSIDDGQTKTLFFRFRASTNNTDQAIGLTDLDTPIIALGDGGGWDQFRVQIRVTSGRFDVRHGGTWYTDTGITLNVGEDQPWYNVWMVINNATGTGSDTFKVYLHQNGDEGATEDNRVTVSGGTVSTFGFRTAVAASLDRFYMKAQGTGAERIVWIDDMYVMAGEDLSFPTGLKPYGPVVEQTRDTVNNKINVTLKWNAAPDPAEVYAVNPDIVNQYIFLSEGSDPNLYYVGATGIDPGTDDPASEYGPVALTPGQACKWVVVEAIDGYAHNGTDNPALTPGVSKVGDVDGDPNNIVGPTWRFTTLLLVPEFTTHPADQWVFPGEPAEFSVALFDDTDTSYQWFKDSAEIDGETSATLSLSEAQLDDEGTYFCRATNTAGSSDSDPALLGIKRLTSYYPLETDVLDAVSGFDMTLMQEGSAGLPTLVSNSVDPSIGDFSLQFDNGNHATDPNGQYAQIDAGVVDYPDITITAWVYWNGGANWQRIFDFGNDTTHYMFLTPSHGSECRFVLNNGGGEQIVSTAPLATGEWVFVAATLDGNTGRLYINGEPRGTNTNVTINPVDIAPTLNYIGKSQFTADAEFDGLLDELKIYNYALDLETIGAEYYSVTGDDPCLYPDFEGSNANFDNTGTSYCRIDLADFAVLARNWLANGLFSEE